MNLIILIKALLNPTSWFVNYTEECAKHQQTLMSNSRGFVIYPNTMSQVYDADTWQAIYQVPTWALPFIQVLAKTLHYQVRKLWELPL